MTKSATTSRGCGANGKPSAGRWRPCGGSTQRFPLRAMFWFWPKIAAALTSKHYWLVINCDSCGTVIDLDLRVKPRDPEASFGWRFPPPLQWAWQVAHHCVGAASVDLKQSGEKSWNGSARKHQLRALKSLAVGAIIIVLLILGVR